MVGYTLIIYQVVKYKWNVILNPKGLFLGNDFRCLLIGQNIAAAG